MPRSSWVVAWTLAREQLGFSNPTANYKRQTFDQIRRFRSSEWQLTDDRYNVLRNFRENGTFERDKYMSFISDLEVVSIVAGRGKTPETIAITFHPSLTPVLTDMERSLTLHREFIQGKYRKTSGAGRSAASQIKAQPEPTSRNGGTSAVKLADLLSMAAARNPDSR